MDTSKGMKSFMNACSPTQNSSALKDRKHSQAVQQKQPTERLSMKNQPSQKSRHKTKRNSLKYF